MIGTTSSYTPPTSFNSKLGPNSNSNGDRYIESYSAVVAVLL